MKLYKIQVFIILNFFIFSSFAQKILTYEGPFQNGLPITSTARYTYYVDKKGQQIKQGSFRYLVKFKTADSRLTHNFAGNYANGLKDGPWEYAIKSKDYGKDAQGFSESADIQLLANYKNGVPEGRWTFTAEVSKRKKLVSNGKEQWVDYQLVKRVYMQVNFKNGVLLDSFQIRDVKGDTLNLFCDDHGLLEGDLLSSNGKRVVLESYKNGFLVEQNGVKYSFNDYYQNNKNKIDIGFKVDTVSLIDRKDFMIANYLNDNIFNPKYFLYERINGDLIFKFNNNGKIVGIKLKGYNYLVLKPLLSKDNEKKISDIYYYRSKLTDFENMALRDLKANPTNQKLQSKIDVYKLIGQEIDGYYCAAKIANMEVLPFEFYKSATKNCGNLPAQFQKIKTTDQWLSELLLLSRNAWMRADKLSHE